ncbi:MAG: LruC domain-containing protein [Thermodesulfobacteriota bacterium]
MKPYAFRNMLAAGCGLVLAGIFTPVAGFCAAPVIDSVSISGYILSTKSRTANVYASDAEEDPLTYDYVWSESSTENGTYTKIAETLVSSSDNNTLDGSFLEPGKWYQVTVTVNDGSLDSSSVSAKSEVGYSYRYPGGMDKNSLVFEDMWPSMGDYDLNDMVVNYRISANANAAGETFEIILAGDLVARGAQYNNGFGVSFKDLTEADYKSGYLYVGGGRRDNRKVGHAPEEGHNNSLTFILFEKMKDSIQLRGPDNAENTADDITMKLLPPNPPFAFYNTETIDNRDTIPFILVVYLKAPKKLSALNTEFFNPFIVCDVTNQLPGKTDGRGTEVHLPGHPPTEKADPSLFGTGDDQVDSSGVTVYKSKNNNLPWALELSGDSFRHPIENTDIVKAYLQMEEWVTSGGSKNQDWYRYREAGLTWPQITTSSVIYEDAQNWNTKGWYVYDDTIAGATITNVYDAGGNGKAGSRVIQLSGSNDLRNGYRLNSDDDSLWNNGVHQMISWSMKTNQVDQDYHVFIAVMTSNTTVNNGFRYLFYHPSSTSYADKTMGGTYYVSHHLADEYKNGQWHTITRDLQADLEAVEPGNEIVSVNAFLIRGNTFVDDIMTLNRSGPEYDTDRLGGDYRYFKSAQESYKECLATCNLEGQCKAWTYQPKGWNSASANNALCWLKSSVPAATTGKTGLVSGVK